MSAPVKDTRKVVLKHSADHPVIAHWANSLLTPRQNDDGSTGKYSCQILIDKNHPSIPALKAALKGAKEKVNITGKCEINFHDGDAKDDEGNFEKEDAVYRGKYYFNASAKKAPGVVIGKDRSPATEDDVYSGMGIAVSVTAFGYNREGRKGLSWGLNNVWILNNCLPVLAGRVSADKEFADMDDVEVRVEKKAKATTADDDDFDDDLGI
jgi:hypothetical protein